MKKPLNALLKTDSTQLSAFVARLTLGLVMLPHGLQKTLGWFGGHGLEGTLGFFTSSLGIPFIVALLVIAAESLGSLAIIFGFLTRFCAASMALVMLGAVSMAHWQNGFFMNWFGQQQGEGYEYHLLVIGLALSLVISGGGKFSVDQKLLEKLQ
ncbi:MAG: DoxX family protein [Bdellovibrionales bacterium]|nr:DoxX family protein [Bdellovibrionales bacterium]